jgi:ferric-dicitrate binding protein FerR (iron transport regulator)
LQEFNNIWKDLQGQLGNEEQNALRAWKAESGNNQRIYQDIKAVWEHSDHLESIQIKDADTAWLEIEGQIQEKTKSNIRSIRWIGVAASFLLVSSFILWYFIQQDADPLYATIATGNERAEIQLADGSTVLLEKNSTARYYTRLDESLENRRIFISGQASCTVAKDSSMPFIADMGETAVEALGTIFSVEKWDSLPVKVENIEGLIKFFEVENEENSVILEQGEIFSYDGDSFIDDTPKIEKLTQAAVKKELPGKEYSFEEIVDILLEKFDGKFNTGPYAKIDKKARVRVDLEQGLPNIIEQLLTKTDIQFKRTCADCYQLDKMKAKSGSGENTQADDPEKSEDKKRWNPFKKKDK